MGGNDPPDPPGADDNSVQMLDTSEQEEVLFVEQAEVENTERAVVLANEQEPMNYAAAAASEPSDEVKDVLRIVLKKTDKSATFYLHHKQKARLIFRELDIPREKVIGIDQEDYRTIRVHMNSFACPYKVAHSIQVKEGLVTLPMRMFRRLTKVKIQRAGIGTSKKEIIDMLEHFGSVEEDVVWNTYYDDHPHPNTLSEDEKMMMGIKSGDATVKMYISTHIPSFALLEGGQKVRVRYNAQPVTCARCHQGIRGCKGNANAAKCEKAGGKAVPLAEYWNILTAREEQGREEGEETAVIPGNALLVEGLGKQAGIDWLRQFLSQGLTAPIEDKQIRRSKDKLSWEITDLSPADIRTVLECCSGTQYKGKTIYCTPVVTSGKFIHASSEIESGDEEEKEEDDDGEKNDDGGKKDDDEKAKEGEDMDTASPLPPASPGRKVDEEGFEEVETKSAKKRREREEKKAKQKAEKEAELDYAKKQGVVNKDGDHPSPPKHKGKSKRKKDGELSPPQGPPRTRQSKEKKLAEQLPSQTDESQ